MITIDRGVESPALASSREIHLRRAVELFNAHGPGSKQLRDELEKGYGSARNELWRRQHKKCAYCEMLTPRDEQPTEHFRPKKYALRSWRDGEAEDRDNHRYWWLTWTWENLLFACTTCNGRSHKGNRFPLEHGTEPLPAPQRPASYPLPAHHFELDREHPLLLDPSDRDIDPIDYLCWRPVDRGLYPSLWQWAVRGRKFRGRVTATTLKLERRSDFVNSIYKSEIWPRFHREIEAQATSRSAEALRAAWDKLTRDLLDLELPLIAARWWMLDTLRSSTKQLERHALPSPPRPPRPS